MKHPLLIALAALAALTPVRISARDFTYTYEGQTLTYTVLDEDAKTVETKQGLDDHAGNNISGDLVLPAHPMDGDVEYTLTTIGEDAFRNCSLLKSVEIPNSVTSIGFCAFCGCEALTNVEIPNSVTTIEGWAFSFCTALSSIEIPNSITTIEHGTFTSCSALASVEIPNSVTIIGPSAFYNCSALTSVQIPNSVTTIGSGAFSSCTALTSIDIPNSVTDIQGRSFGGCNALTEINVDSGNQSYSSEDGVLFDYDKKALIMYPEGKEGPYTIPNSVTTIGDNAFSGSKLTSVQIPNSVTSIGESAFSFCEALTSAIISNSMSSIVDRLFWGCSALTSVKIPNSVTTIGTWAFSGCKSLTSVEIPNSVTTIAELAFGGCDALTDVTCWAKVPPTLSYSFQMNEDSYLYVPAASVSAYENSDWAQYFTGIKAINNPTGVDEVGAPDSGVRVSVWQNTVTITGLEPGAQVSVYDMAGNMVYAGNEHSLTLPAGQAYIVSTPSKTFKVAL